MLKKLEATFEESYQEFSSFEKWQKQVNQQHFQWTTVHNEKFWRDNAHCFNINAENLKLIEKEIHFLTTH